MKFLGRIAASLVIGWILGLVLAVILSGGMDIQQTPVFTVPFAIVVTYCASFFFVRPNWW